jgi:hypothetical protein
MDDLGRRRLRQSDKKSGKQAEPIHRVSLNSFLGWMDARAYARVGSNCGIPEPAALTSLLRIAQHVEIHGDASPRADPPPVEELKSRVLARGPSRG